MEMVMIKPLAYINVEERKLEWAEPITWHTPTIAQMEKIPLYTYPAKTLTDEEIEEFAYAFELWQLNNPDKALEGIIDFAKAILKKASEK
jgi:hypothetical protein